MKIEDSAAERSRDLYAKIVAIYTELYAKQPLDFLLYGYDSEELESKPQAEREIWLAERVGRLARQAAIAAMREMNKPIIHIDAESSGVLNLNVKIPLCGSIGMIAGLERVVDRRLLNDLRRYEICAECLAIQAKEEQKKNG